MVKHTILFSAISFLFLSGILQASSQNFRTVVSGHDSYYKAAYSIWTYQLEENIQAVKIDSVVSLLSGDSVFYFYKQMQDTSYIYGECNLDMTAPCWLGTHALIRPDGENLFFNREGDTISIKTLAGLGDSWVFNRQEDYYFRATLESIELSPEAGTNDSVKIISLQTFSNSGSPVPNWFNQKKICFSKNHGFTELYSFYNFPADTNRFELFEYEPLTIASVFDFGIGDVFHFKNGSDLAGPPQYKVITILSKWLSADTDTIYYLQREKKYINTLIFDPDPHVTHTTKTDTVTVWYANPDSLLSEVMPHQQIFSPYSSLGYYSLTANSDNWNNRPTMSYDFSTTHMFDESLNCYTAAFEPTYQYNCYTKGCGASFWFHEEPSDFSGFYNKLVYYIKGNETWGDPYILNSVNELPAKELFVEVFPNPFSDRIEIQIELKTPGTTGLYLYSMSGLLLLKMEDALKQPGIYTSHPDLSGLAKGVYILKYCSGENIGYKKLIRN
jgi:hypothetical protein